VNRSGASQTDAGLRPIAGSASQACLSAGGGGERVAVDPEAAQGADRGAVLHVGDREHHVRADELRAAVAGELPAASRGVRR
jgi:hypothetical protein